MPKTQAKRLKASKSFIFSKHNFGKISKEKCKILHHEWWDWTFGSQFSLFLDQSCKRKEKKKIQLFWVPLNITLVKKKNFFHFKLKLLKINPENGYAYFCCYQQQTTIHGWWMIYKKKYEFYLRDFFRRKRSKKYSDYFFLKKVSENNRELFGWIRKKHGNHLEKCETNGENIWIQFKYFLSFSRFWLKFCFVGLNSFQQQNKTKLNKQITMGKKNEWESLFFHTTLSH